MMRSLAVALFAVVVGVCSPALSQTSWPTAGGSQAQGVVFMCLNAQGQAVPSTAAGTCLSAGGGGGGLSVVDQAAFTYGTSPFTPGGGFYNSSITPLSSGQQGAFALTPNRSLHTLDDNSVAILAGVTAPIPAGTNLIGSTAPATIAQGATFVKGTTAAMTGTAATQIIAAVAAKVVYVTRIKCNNSSATATLVQITDGSGGTVLDTLAAGATFGGEQGTGPTPLFWTTSGNGLFAQDVTTSASVICTASGYSG